MQKVAAKGYLPTNQMLLDLIREYGQQFKVSFSVTGTALVQMEKYSPQTLEAFKTRGQLVVLNFLVKHTPIHCVP